MSNISASLRPVQKQFPVLFAGPGLLQQAPFRRNDWAMADASFGRRD
jgi:hypothetical protein